MLKNDLSGAQANKIHQKNLQLILSEKENFGTNSNESFIPEGGSRDVSNYSSVKKEASQSR